VMRPAVFSQIHYAYVQPNKWSLYFGSSMLLFRVVVDVVIKANYLIWYAYDNVTGNYRRHEY